MVQIYFILFKFVLERKYIYAVSIISWADYLQ